jgi:hypothetical protein
MSIVGQGGKILLFALPSLFAAMQDRESIPDTSTSPRDYRDWRAQQRAERWARREARWHRRVGRHYSWIGGAILVLVGVALLLQSLDLTQWLPALLIVAGLALLGTVLLRR